MMQNASRSLATALDTCLELRLQVGELRLLAEDAFGSSDIQQMIIIAASAVTERATRDVSTITELASRRITALERLVAQAKVREAHARLSFLSTTIRGVRRLKNELAATRSATIALVNETRDGFLAVSTALRSASINMVAAVRTANDDAAAVSTAYAAEIADTRHQHIHATAVALRLRFALNGHIAMLSHCLAASRAECAQLATAMLDREAANAMASNNLKATAEADARERALLTEALADAVAARAIADARADAADLSISSLRGLLAELPSRAALASRARRELIVQDLGSNHGWASWHRGWDFDNKQRMDIRQRQCTPSALAPPSARFIRNNNAADLPVSAAAVAAIAKPWLVDESNPVRGLDASVALATEGQPMIVAPSCTRCGAPAGTPTERSYAPSTTSKVRRALDTWPATLTRFQAMLATADAHLDALANEDVTTSIRSVSMSDVQRHIDFSVSVPYDRRAPVSVVERCGTQCTTIVTSPLPCTTQSARSLTSPRTLQRLGRLSRGLPVDTTGETIHGHTNDDKMHVLHKKRLRFDDYTGCDALTAAYALISRAQ